MSIDEIHDWNEKIMSLIDLLKEDHPELINFLDEIPMTIPDDIDPHITVNILKEYYQTLQDLENLKQP